LLQANVSALDSTLEGIGENAVVFQASVNQGRHPGRSPELHWVIPRESLGKKIADCIAAYPAGFMHIGTIFSDPGVSTVLRLDT
jgi:hypothetical protein